MFFHMGRYTLKTTLKSYLTELCCNPLTVQIVRFGLAKTQNLVFAAFFFKHMIGKFTPESAYIDTDHLHCLARIP